MIKVYEIKGKQAAQLIFNYFGIQKTLMFEGGSITNGLGATFSTEDKFTQDAIEHDYRFGNVIRIQATYRTAADDEADAAAAAAQAPVTPAKKPAKKAAAKTPDVEGPVAIDSCNDINDVLAFFAEKGELATSEEELKDLASKYNVTFPNVKF